jgi:dynein heavy chain
MEAVCVLLQEKPDWDTAKKVLGNDVLRRLMDFDKDNVPEKVIKKLEKYTKDEGYTPETVGKVSAAAKSLCMWTHAMDVYSKVAKDVGPKKEALANAQATLAGANAVLKGKQDELAAVIARVAGLEAQLAQAEEDQKTLADQVGSRPALCSDGKVANRNVRGFGWGSGRPFRDARRLPTAMKKLRIVILGFCTS